MSRELKVWGIGLHNGRAIVAAHNQKTAALLMEISLHHLRTYGSETGNSFELTLAKATPGKVWRENEKDRTWSLVE